MIRGFEACVFVTILVVCVTRQNGRYIENYRGLLVRERELRGRFVSKCVEPKRALAEDYAIGTIRHTK